MADFDVQKLAEEAARAQYRSRTDLETAPPPIAWVEDAAVALAVIVPAVTQHLRDTLHHPYITTLGDYCAECGTKWPCKTEREMQKFDAAVRGERS